MDGTALQGVSHVALQVSHKIVAHQTYLARLTMSLVCISGCIDKMVAGRGGRDGYAESLSNPFPHERRDIFVGTILLLI